MGVYGGILAIDTNLNAINEPLTKKLNTELFSDLVVHSGQLIAESHKGPYYFDTDSVWKPYTKKYDVPLFDVVYMDEDYIFYPLDGGEFGSALCVYDIEKRITRGILIDKEVSAIRKVGENYRVYTNLFHGIGSSAIYELGNRDVQAMHRVDEVHRYTWKKELILNRKPEDYGKPKRVVYFGPGEVLVSAMVLDTTTYLVMHFNSIEKKFDINTTYIFTRQAGKRKLVDSIPRFDWAKRYEVPSSILGRNLLLRGNKLIGIKFNGTPNYATSVNSDKIALVDGKEVQNSVSEKFSSLWSSGSKRELVYQLRDSSMLYSKGTDNAPFRITISKGGKKYKLLLYGVVVGQAFQINGNDVLYIRQLGNRDEYKYGLIEITDLDRFTQLYCR